MKWMLLLGSLVVFVVHVGRPAEGRLLRFARQIYQERIRPIRVTLAPHSSPADLNVSPSSHLAKISPPARLRVVKIETERRQ